MSTKNIKLEEIISLFKEGKNTSEIGELLGCSQSNISGRLRRAGFNTKRDYSKTRFHGHRTHSVDDHYFDIIDTEGKAYFLGLMYADGSVTKTQFYLKLKDEDILHKFKSELKCTYPIRTIESPWKAYILQVSSITLCRNLIKWGCIPNKTSVIRLPNISNELIRHFIRGFFDGDGCLQLNDKIYHCRFDLASASLEFLKDVRPIITANSLTNGSLNKEAKYEVWHLNYSGHQVVKILNWLYKDTHFFLKRKYDKYQILKYNYDSKFA